MSARESFIECKQMSKADFRETGGCTWPQRPNSPGHSLRIPHGTRFRIAVEGPQSHVYVDGICENGKWLVLSGDAKGEYKSANQAVAAVRRNFTVSNNAYLYLEFRIGSEWVSACRLRYDNDLAVSFDPVDEEAMVLARAAVRRKRPGPRSVEEVEVLAERAVRDDPRFIRMARDRVAASEDLMA